MSWIGETSAGTLVIAGGYGVVGTHVARILRRRHPHLRLILTGRHPQAACPLAESVGASVSYMDVEEERPLDRLAERPAAVLAAVSDPRDRLLVNAMRLGVPIADIDRGGHAQVLDAALRIACERPRAPVLLAGGWMSGLAALACAATASALARAERIEITALISPEDRVGPDASGFGRRLAWPYHGMREGRRLTVHPLSGIRRAPCPDGRTRSAALVATLEQITVPLTLGVGTVETRIALWSPTALWGLVALKRSGALRALDRPELHRLRDALLHRSGTGDLAGFTVTAWDARRSASIDVLDVHGQAHLSALGAAAAAERLLGLASVSLPAGLSFPEQSTQGTRDLLMLREAGVHVRVRLPAAGRGLSPPGRGASLPGGGSSPTIRAQSERRALAAVGERNGRGDLAAR